MRALGHGHVPPGPRPRVAQATPRPPFARGIIMVPVPRAACCPCLNATDSATVQVNHGQRAARGTGLPGKRNCDVTCDGPNDLLHAYLDGEPDAARRVPSEQHLPVSP